MIEKWFPTDTKFSDYIIEEGMLNLYYPVKFLSIKNMGDFANKIQLLPIVVSQETVEKGGITVAFKNGYEDILLEKEKNTTAVEVENFNDKLKKNEEAKSVAVTSTMEPEHVDKDKPFCQRTGWRD